jgi:hypothetical protein
MRNCHKIFAALLTFVVSAAFTAQLAVAQTPTASETPVPSLNREFQPMTKATGEIQTVRGKSDFALPDGAPPLGLTFPAFDFNDNGTLTGYLFIPPDPIGASGPFQVVNVGNVMIQWFTKIGLMQYHQSLNTFFAPLGPPLGTWTFDPKVIYDQYNERFIVIALEQTDTYYGDPTDDSYILVAVSKTFDPNMGWWYLAIPSKLNIGGYGYWADYPGLAVGPNAIYVTSNLFRFAAGGGNYGGSRLWIIHKNPFYSGGAPVWTIHDPYASAGSATTTQPAHMFGTVPAGMGTFLTSYSGLTDGANEYVQVVQVLNPTGAVSFNQQYVNIGDIEGPSFPALPDAPQNGTTYTIEVNDRRALNAVWRSNELWVSTTILPNSGTDANQTTAHWFNLNAVGAGSVTPTDQGDVGAEDLGNNTYTFFPSLVLDKCGNMAIGFAASNSTIYPGAYYTGRLSTDPAGTVQSTGALAVGQDWYYRAFGGTRNRWGDYSGISLDPGDEVTFWVFNEYAMQRGTPISGEDGRWATQWGSFALGCQPVSVTITAFDARATSEGVELTARFESDSDLFRVDVYRSNGGARELYQSVDVATGESFRFLDRRVQPGQTYQYSLAVEDDDGRFFSPTSTVTVPVLQATLFQNKPNPFNPVTTIRYVVPSTEHVTLAVYDAHGTLVRVLVDGVRGFGPHEAEWDGTDDLGNRVGSGIYFYRLEVGKFRQSMKMLLLK